MDVWQKGLDTGRFHKYFGKSALQLKAAAAKV
jgi:hypothetical protein